MFCEKIVSLKNDKIYNNYEEFINNNSDYKNTNLYYIPNDQFNSKNINYLSKTFMTIAIIKYIQTNFDINYIYEKYLKNNMCITQCGSSITILLLLSKKKFNFDELLLYIKDSNIYNVVINFCNFIRKNYKLSDFYAEKLFIKIVELKNLNINVNYYRDFTDIDNLCDYITYTCNHYFITNISHIPMTINKSIVLDINIINIKDENINKYCSKKRDNKLFSIIMNDNLRYLIDINILNIIDNLNFIKLDYDVIPKQYEYCNENKDYFMKLI